MLAILLLHLLGDNRSYFILNPFFVFWSECSAGQFLSVTDKPSPRPLTDRDRAIFTVPLSCQGS